jgi:hypothetical protein
VIGVDTHKDGQLAIALAPNGGKLGESQIPTTRKGHDELFVSRSPLSTRLAEITAPPAGISEADWLATPSAVRALILAQPEVIQQHRAQLAARATELTSLREQIGRTSRHSSRPPSSNGPALRPPERRKGSGRMGGRQPGHPGTRPGLLPIERVG